MMSSTASLVIFTVLATSLCAQSPLPSFVYLDAYKHEINPQNHEFPMQGITGGFNRIGVTLTISPTGIVTDAHPNDQPQLLKYWPQLEPEVRKWKFTPFEVQGHAATVEIKEYLRLLPPGRLPTHHVPPPALASNSHVVITLERTRCYGSCPAYAVTISNDGIVFDGRMFVRVKGISKAKVDPAKLRALAEKFVSADFYSMDDSYHAMVTDNPTKRLTISIDGHSKQVVDYVGAEVGMPAVITELEEDVDRLAQTQRWIKDPQ